MGKVKEINFFNDIFNIEEFDSSLLKTDKESYKDTDIFYNGYIAIKKVVIMKIFIV